MWPLVIACTAGVAAGLASWYRIPAQDRSETRIGVVPATVSDVHANGDDDARARTRLVSENILSYSRLKPIIDGFNLYANEGSLVSAEDRARWVRSHIDVTFEANAASVRVAF